MSTINEIKNAVSILRKNNNKFQLMYCCSSYPAPISEIDMNVMLNLKKKFKCDVGFSDHTLGFESAISSTIFGAKFIEKTFYY